MFDTFGASDCAGAGEGLNMVEAGAGLPPPEEPVDEALIREGCSFALPKHDCLLSPPKVDMDPEAMYEEGAPEEPISEEPEAGYGEGPPLLLVAASSSSGPGELRSGARFHGGSVSRLHVSSHSGNVEFKLYNLLC